MHSTVQEGGGTDHNVQRQKNMDFPTNSSFQTPDLIAVEISVWKKHIKHLVYKVMLHYTIMYNFPEHLTQL